VKTIQKPCQLALVLGGMGLLLWTGPPAEQLYAHPDSGCASCHVPHGAAGDNTEVPLWNPAYTETTLTEFYSSPSLDATVSQVDGASKLCLSCHDGTNSRVQSQGRTNFGSGGAMEGLENSHPVSFVYDQSLAVTDGALVDPDTLPRGVLDGSGKMQCSSCHEVHRTPTRQEESNLRWAYVKTGGPSNTTAAFCRNCHIK